MSPTRLKISQSLGELKGLAPAGYALAFHLKFTTSKFLFQTYPKKWLDYYSKNGLVMVDPTVAWGFSNVGSVAWSSLAHNDSNGVFEEAAKHGINSGMTCATEDGGTRSMGSFSRSDREFNDGEIAQITAIFNRLHADTADHAQLSPETVQQLHKMSVLVTHPGS